MCHLRTRGEDVSEISTVFGAHDRDLAHDHGLDHGVHPDLLAMTMSVSIAQNNDEQTLFGKGNLT